MFTPAYCTAATVRSRAAMRTVNLVCFLARGDSHSSRELPCRAACSGRLRLHAVIANAPTGACEVDTLSVLKKGPC
jgi:hypothetical protein